VLRMNLDESRILIGGRKLRKIPPQSKLFVEHEAETSNQVSLRQRRQVITNTPNQLPGYYSPPSHPPPPPPAYSSPTYWTPPRKSQVPSQQLYDSGYYGYSESKFNSSYSSEKPIIASRSYWDKLNTPVDSWTGGRARGRSSFFDDEPRGWSVGISPQNILACLLSVTIISSLGFALIISVKNFDGDEGKVPSLNGKYSSIKFASEKSTLDDSGNTDDLAENDHFESRNFQEDKVEELSKDPIFEIMDEIGEMSDTLLAEKLETDELNLKIEASKINIERVEKENINVVEEGEKISEELLTHSPLVLENKAPTQAPESKTEHEPTKSELKSTNVLIEASVQELAEELINSNELIDTPEGKKHEASNGQKSEDFEPKVKSKRKSKHANPLMKDVNTKKMSKAKKMVKKITVDAEDVGVDYPDLPTFRGVKTTEDQEDEIDDIEVE